MRDASRNRLALEIVRCTLFLLCLVMASAFTTPIGNLFVFCTQTHGFFGCRYQYDIFRMPQDGKHDGHVLRTRRRYRGVCQAQDTPRPKSDNLQWSKGPAPNSG